MIILIMKNNVFRSLIFVFIILILISLISLLINKAYSEWKENKVVNKQKENKGKIIKTFKENKHVFDNLVEYMYSRDGEIQINFSKENIQLINNGKDEKLDEEHYNLLNELYTLLKCKRARLHKSSSGSKILEIYLEDEGVYSDLIIFCKDKNEGFTEEFSPGWYYKTLWHT